MRYLDTSLIVAALTSEVATPRAQPCVTAAPEVVKYISDWSLTEFSSALSIKVRSGQLTIDTRASILARFNRYVAESFVLIPVTAMHFRKAASFADDYTTGLRSGDALHLAIAATFGATVWTLDQRMSEAGPIVGVPTRLV